MSVDIAINHDPEAIKMHKANHPSTKHYCEDVWEVDPIEACNGHPVALAWFSPDCKHFSKAKGGKPKDKFIRGLAWVALRWASKVRPRVIMLENVEEFKTWGPLNRRHHPIKSKVGATFDKFCKQLRDLGYDVEFNELVAADYGAPTMRKRFFMVARCDGRPIVWPEHTNAPRDSEEVKRGLCKPYVPAYECLDFSLPCPSIFDSSEEIKEKYGLRAVRPLASKTMDRIARGLKKFVIDNPEPFIIQCKFNNGPQSIKEPLGTITTVGSHLLVEPKITPYIAPIIDKAYGGNYKGSGSKANEPIDTITTVDHNRLVAASLIQYHSYEGESVRGQGLKEPLMTVDGSNRYGLVTSFLSKFYKSGIGQDVREPLHTVTSAGHFGEVRAFLIKYYGDSTGQDINAPLVTIHGVDYQIVDIGLRMLEPRELYNAQGFPDDYIIDNDYTGHTYSRTEQVKRCGNAVPPPFAAALVKANLPELHSGERVKNMRVKQEETGQMQMFA